jgi:hypothetical protein
MNEEDFPAFIPWNSDRRAWPTKLEDAWRRNYAPYRWQPPTGEGMNGAGWKRTYGNCDTDAETPDKDH